MAANFLELPTFNIESDKCMICLEDLSSEIQYSLPECGHAYHQNCIMQWFRSGSCKCPLCNNLGLNDTPGMGTLGQGVHTDRNWGWWRGGRYKYRMIRQYSRRKNAPKKLKKEVEKLKKIEDKRILIRKELKEFKNKEGKFGALKTEYNKLRSKKWRLDTSIRGRQMAIANFNIIPIIIAKKITI